MQLCVLSLIFLIDFLRVLSSAGKREGLVSRDFVEFRKNGCPFHVFLISEQAVKCETDVEMSNETFLPVFSSLQILSGEDHIY